MDSGLFGGNATLGTAAMLIVGVLGLLAFSFLFLKIAPHWVLAILLSLAVLQGFRPIGYISIFLLVCLAAVPRLIRDYRFSWRDWMLYVFAAILLRQVLSAAWSPVLGAVAHAALSTFCVVVIYLLARLAVRSEPSLSRVLTVAAPFVLLQAVATIVFRLFPSVQDWYFGLGIARWLSEPGVESIASNPQNVTDPGKAGGFFLNGNIAALFLGVVACVYLYSFAITRALSSLAIAVVMIAGVVATGSKSGLGLAIALPILAAVVMLASRNRRLAILSLIGAAFIGIVSVAAVAIGNPALLEVSIRTLGDRGLLWTYAAQQFPLNPITGMGYGGWLDRLDANFVSIFGPDRPYDDFPPHNLFIQAWADAGIVLALLVIATVVISVARGVRFAVQVSARSGRWSFLEGGVILAALLWFPLHGMLDTTAFYGENRTLAFYALVLAIASERIVARRRDQNDTSSSEPALLPQSELATSASGAK